MANYNPFKNGAPNMRHLKGLPTLQRRGQNMPVLYTASADEKSSRTASLFVKMKYRFHLFRQRHLITLQDGPRLPVTVSSKRPWWPKRRPLNFTWKVWLPATPFSKEWILVSEASFFMDSNDGATLTLLWVIPALRRKGIGSFLLRQMNGTVVKKQLQWNKLHWGIYKDDANALVLPSAEILLSLLRKCAPALIDEGGP